VAGRSGEGRAVQARTQARSSQARSPQARSAQARGTARVADPRRTKLSASQARARAKATRTRRRLRPLGRPDVRLRAGLIALLLLLLVLGGRLVQLQGVDADRYASQAEGQRIVTDTILAARGAIKDRNGQPLAVTVDARTIFGDPLSIAKAAEGCDELASSRAALLAAGRQLDAAKPCTATEIAAALAPILGEPVEELTKKLTSTTSKGVPFGYVVLSRDREPEVADAIAALKLVGIGNEPAPRRDHPGGDLAANLTGFTTKDGVGAGGVELMLDGILAGKNGTGRREVDGAGRTIPTGEATRTEAVPGRDVELTIDRDLQWYAQRVLAAKVQETQAVNGSAVVMDVKTGEILAMATAPTFNAARPGDSPAAYRNNPAIGDIYDPGSVNKIITISTAIEKGLVTPDTVLTVPYSQKFGAKLVKDSHSHPTERYTVNGILIQSSNVGTVQIAEKLGKQGVYDAMKNFGYAAKTGLGLPGESAGLLPKPADWSGSSMGTIPIGQGVSVNAVQVASVYQTVANGGVRVAPSILRSTVDEAGRSVPTAPSATRRVISEKTAAAMMPMLEGVVSAEGTGALAAIPGYRIAGKTGTADRASLQPDGKVRYDGSYTSSFVGFAPADAPRFVTAVVLQGTGKNGYYGGSTAGPVFKQVMAFALQSMGVPPTGKPFRMPAIFADGHK
jgi:cell division protein FtsI (penicillin-binding protein 3)